MFIDGAQMVLDSRSRTSAFTDEARCACKRARHGALSQARVGAEVRLRKSFLKNGVHRPVLSSLDTIGAARDALFAAAGFITHTLS